MIDRERIVQKIEYLDNEIEALRGLLDGLTAGAADPFAVRGLRYSLQPSAEVVIDVCYHVSAKARHHVPQGAHDALEAAVRGSEIDRQQIQRWHDLIGLRDRLVHGYEEIADERLVADAKAGVGDLAAFLRLAQQWVGAGAV